MEKRQLKRKGKELNQLHQEDASSNKKRRIGSGENNEKNTINSTMELTDTDQKVVPKFAKKLKVVATKLKDFELGIESVKNILQDIPTCEEDRYKQKSEEATSGSQTNQQNADVALQRQKNLSGTSNCLSESSYIRKETNIISYKKTETQLNSDSEEPDSPMNNKGVLDIENYEINTTPNISDINTQKTIMKTLELQENNKGEVFIEHSSHDIKLIGNDMMEMEEQIHQNLPNPTHCAASSVEEIRENSNDNNLSSPDFCLKNENIDKDSTKNEILRSANECITGNKISYVEDCFEIKENSVTTVGCLKDVNANKVESQQNVSYEPQYCIDNTVNNNENIPEKSSQHQADARSPFSELSSIINSKCIVESGEVHTVSLTDGINIQSLEAEEAQTKKLVDGQKAQIVAEKSTDDQKFHTVEDNATKNIVACKIMTDQKTVATNLTRDHKTITEYEDRNEITDSQLYDLWHSFNKEYDDKNNISDSQLCAVNWAEELQISTHFSKPFKYRKREISNGTGIVKGLIKELSSLNMMILRTKREIEQTRRQTQQPMNQVISRETSVKGNILK